MKTKLLAALIAEAIGTFALIFIGLLAVTVDKFANTGLVGIALASGLAMAVMVSSLGAVSGGHFNPAITFGLLLGQRIEAKWAILYWVAQVAGAVIAAFIANALLPATLGGVPAAAGIPMLHQALTIAQGIGLEAIGTFLLVMVVYGNSFEGRPTKAGGFLIGLTITLDMLAFGPLTGGAVNPARWLGPAVATSNYANAIVWIVGPLLGGIMAGLLYPALFSDAPTTSPSP